LKRVFVLKSFKYTEFVVVGIDLSPVLPPFVNN
jgi:hypothetical protein